MHRAGFSPLVVMCAGLRCHVIAGFITFVFCFFTSLFVLVHITRIIFVIIFFYGIYFYSLLVGVLCDVFSFFVNFPW